MDEIVKKIAGLGVPGLFLLVAMSAASASGLVGARDGFRQWID